LTWEYIFESDLDSIAQARGHVREALVEHTDEATLGHVELVVSELVTNSVRHGPGRPITLKLAASEAGDIAGEVHDDGEGVVALRSADDMPAVGGLGLLLVDSLASDWGVHPGSTNVWFRFEAAA
jgi:anti-sigma regulatory factor (Ser/Thr protein kinase)